jgi:hypothetical protein
LELLEGALTRELSRGTVAERPSASEIYRATKRLREELEQHGMLLAHDVLLPSATRSVAGVSIRGSWWGHPAGALIYEALKGVESELARVKLVAKKSTLVHRRLWPALVAVARSGQAWQTAGLAPGEAELLSRVEREHTVRVDRLPSTGSAKPAELAKQLELRLLVFATSVHTDSGQHAKLLTSVSDWQASAGVSDAELPSVESAVEALTAPVRAWVGERLAGLLPWLPPAPRKGARSRN